MSIFHLEAIIKSPRLWPRDNSLGLIVLHSKRTVSIMLNSMKHLPQFIAYEKQRIQIEQIGWQKVTSISSLAHMEHVLYMHVFSQSSTELTVELYLCPLLRDSQTSHFCLDIHAIRKQDTLSKQAIYFNSNTRGIVFIFFLSLLFLFLKVLWNNR